jgi:hypothetical protein
VLKLNGRVIFSNAGKQTGAFYGQTGNSFRDGGRNRNAGGFNQTFSAYPNGTLSPSAFILPQKSGSLSSYTLSGGTLSPNANLIPAKNLEASASLTITVTNAQLDQIVSFIASGSCSISVVNAILGNVATLQANGTMQLTSDALCGAIFTVTANGNGQVTGSPFLSALAHLEAEAGGPTPLSPEGLANAVWSEDLTPYSGVSAGQALKDAGSAGNPWSATLASNNTPGTFGWFVQKLLTVAKYLGLR